MSVFENVVATSDAKSDMEQIVFCRYSVFLLS